MEGHPWSSLRYVLNSRVAKEDPEDAIQYGKKECQDIWKLAAPSSAIGAHLPGGPTHRHELKMRPLRGCHRLERIKLESSACTMQWSSYPHVYSYRGAGD